MIDSSEGLNRETPNFSEIPSHVKTVALPDIYVEDKRIRLGMHTDSVMTLLRTLENLPDLDKIKIEGRILTPAQESELMDDPVYNFYLSGRMVRATGQKEDIFVLPKENQLNQGEVATLLQTPFTPSVLSEKIGFKVGYFSAKQMIADYNSSFSPNDFLPIIGGINEFKIGSDVLSDNRLIEITEEIKRAFVKQEGLVPTPIFSPSILKNFQTFNVTPMLSNSQMNINFANNINSIPKLSDTQIDINNPDQIKNLSDITVGETYRAMHDGKPGLQYKIVADPYQDKEDGWWVKVETFFPSGGSYIDDISLADNSVVPYSSGKWNPSNSLVKETNGK